jgi:uncharacterized protein (TIGR02284 family)
MNNPKSIAILNTFIDINNKRFKSCEKASINSNDMDLIMLFVDFREKTQKHKAELVSEVQKLGGKPKKDSKTLKTFSRIWIKIKSKLNPYDREDILNRCEYDMDIILNNFKNVLSTNSEYLTPNQQYLLTTQHQSIKKDHDTLKGLRDLMVMCRKFNLDN